MHFCPRCGKPGWMVGKRLFRCVDPECKCEFTVDDNGIVSEVDRYDKV